MVFIRKPDRGNCSIKFSHSIFHRAIHPETTRNSSWSSVGAVTENNRHVMFYKQSLSAPSYALYTSHKAACHASAFTAMFTRCLNAVCSLCWVCELNINCQNYRDLLQICYVKFYKSIFLKDVLFVPLLSLYMSCIHVYQLVLMFGNVV